MRRIFRLAIGLGLLAGAARAVPTEFQPPDPLPPTIEDTTRAPGCTVAYVVLDMALNDLLARRMQIAPSINDNPVDNGFGERMPCPREIPPRLAARALDACAARAADAKTCVYADMGREFLTHPTADNTAENSSRCTSDTATDLGVACWRDGSLELCGVGCGTSPETAIAAATKRCETRHQHQCPITATMPVLGPR